MKTLITKVYEVTHEGEFCGNSKTKASCEQMWFKKFGQEPYCRLFEERVFMTEDGERVIRCENCHTRCREANMLTPTYRE